MTNETKKQASKLELNGLPELAAFIYAFLVFIMSFGYLDAFFILKLRMESANAHVLSLLLGALFAYIGNRGVRALFELRRQSKQ